MEAAANPSLQRIWARAQMHAKAQKFRRVQLLSLAKLRRGTELQLIAAYMASLEPTFVTEYGMVEPPGKPVSEEPSLSDRWPLAAWFLGPRAENSAHWQELIDYILNDYIHWRRNYFPTDPVVVGRARRRSATHAAWLDELTSRLDAILNELKHHFPFHSPRYIAHMLSEQTLPAFLGYFAGMLYNPNNVTDEAAPITVSLELEVGRMVSAMLGYSPKRSWAHLCSGGTSANLEALWVARTVQFVPFVVREFCQQQTLPFVIKTANLEQRDITTLDDTTLLALRPNESIFMLRKLAHYLHEQRLQPYEAVLIQLNAHYQQSAFNVARRGFAQLAAKLKMFPRIFVSAAAHYSVAKAANVLGYGEDSVVSIPTNSRFQLDIHALADALEGLPADEYVAAVIGIVGTTEEGAVDPIHEIRFLRDRMEKDFNRSYWLHVDAAWGGYFRSLFCNSGVPRAPHDATLDDICDLYVRTLQVEERFSLDLGTTERRLRTFSIRWAERELYKSFLAMSDADSTTVDPHKMGYIPYPAGLVAFRNGLVTELIVQRAQYISDEKGGLKSIDHPADVNAVGPYILEGSKAGATALSCWLAHKTIPLETHGHGKIVRTTLLSAKKLFKYLVNHRHLLRRLHHDVTGSYECLRPFTFFPLSEPDTNIVCFIARPMAWSEGRLVPIDISLRWINRFNEAIYNLTSIPGPEGRRRGSARQAFFVSRTRFEERQYSAESIASILERNFIDAAEYRTHSLFVLRSVVMNPWHFESERAGINYLFGFVKHLHEAACTAIDALNSEMEQEQAEQRQRSRRGV